MPSNPSIAEVLRLDEQNPKDWRHRVFNTGMSDAIESADGTRITPLSHHPILIAYRTAAPQLARDLSTMLEAAKLVETAPDNKLHVALAYLRTTRVEIAARWSKA